MSWKEFFKKNTALIIALAILFLFTLFSIYNALQYVETRKGVVLNDPFLNLIKAYDVSKPLFILTYLSSIIGIIYVIRKPKLTIITAITYILMLWLRMTCMYLTPLEPPYNIVPLRDFLLESTFYSGNVNLKDLFFSGHTATAFMFFLVVKNKILKWIFLFFSVSIASLVLIQHAHYTIDVFVAPIMSWFAFQMAKKAYNKLFKE